MSWRVVDHITIYRQQGWYGAHPNIVRTPNGDLLALFHRSPVTGQSHHAHPLFDIRACRSSDEGRTWGPPDLITTDPLGGVIDFGTHTVADGSLFLHASTVELVAQDTPDSIECAEWLSRPGIGFWVRSQDDGVSWTHPLRFPPLPDAVNGHPAEHTGVCRSGLLEMPDGRWLLPSKATENEDGSQPFFGMLRVSQDRGETWAYAGRIAQDEVAHFSEPTIHLTPGGRIIVLFRCHPGRPGEQSALAEVYSDDGGETWSPWRKTTMEGCPAHMLGLRDGRIFATVGTRWEGQRGCVARVLDAEGGDLDTAPDLIVRADSHGADCGYPWSVELEDGRVLVVYYYTYEDNLRGIEGTVVEEV